MNRFLTAFRKHKNRVTACGFYALVRSCNTYNNLENLKVCEKPLKAIHKPAAKFPFVLYMV